MIVKGNLITMALNGEFDVIAHGCNTQSVQASGIAVQMVKAFGTDRFPMENKGPDINKLGTIDWIIGSLGKNSNGENSFTWWDAGDKKLIVVNAYTQTFPGIADPWNKDIPLNYEALEMCLNKLRYRFPDARVGLPWIGCGLAGGDKGLVKSIIKNSLKSNYKIVEYDS